MKTVSPVVSALVIGFLLGLAWPLAVEAQTTAPSGGGNLSELPTARNNVKAGTLANNAPGNWVSSGIGTHIESKNRMLKNFGGATIDAPSDEDAGIKEQLLPALVDSFLNALDDLVAVIQGIILAGGLTPTTSPS